MKVIEKIYKISSKDKVYSIVIDTSTKNINYKLLSVDNKLIDELIETNTDSLVNSVMMSSDEIICRQLVTLYEKYRAAY